MSGNRGNKANAHTFQGESVFIVNTLCVPVKRVDSINTLLEVDMAYQRKTTDEYTIQGNYGYGWEDVTAEESYMEARARLKEYR